LFLVFSACQQKGTEQKVASDQPDSLSYWFEKANNAALPYDKRLAYTNKAVAVFSNRKNDSLNRTYYFKASNRYYNIGAMKENKKITLQAIQKSAEARDTVLLAKGYNYMGDYYVRQSASDSAYYYYSQAEKMYKLLKDNTKTAFAVLRKSELQFNEKDYIASEKAAFEALKYLRQTDDNVSVYQTYDLLGRIYNELKEFDNAITYHNKALSIAEKLNTSETNSSYGLYQPKATSFNNIGLIFQDRQQHKKAIQYFKKGLAQPNVFKEAPLVYRGLTENLAYSKLKIKDFTQLPGLFYRSLQICDSLNYTLGKVGSNNHLSEYYAYQKDTAKAYRFAQTAYKLSREINVPRSVLSSLQQLAAVDPQNSEKYSKNYIRINDSLQLAERKVRNKIARIEFETEEITLEKDRLVEERATIITWALGILIIGIFIYIVTIQRARNRELQLVQQQQKANEEIYRLLLDEQSKIENVRQSEKKRIGQELHDGVLGKLFGTRMNLGLLNTFDSPDAIKSRASFIDELKILEQELREISHDLSAEKAAEFNNFVVLVNDLIESQKNVCKAHIEVTMDPEIDWAPIDNITKINLYRILQESFQNINKYANAKQVTVEFQKTGNRLILKVKDNGSGFQNNQKKKGIGLTNMETRIKNSGGHLQISSEPGKGTLLKFELPLKPVII
jgi:signal transduction histidine kinase/Flp pilus assembly protein TadD